MSTPNIEVLAREADRVESATVLPAVEGVTVPEGVTADRAVDAVGASLRDRLALRAAAVQGERSAEVVIPGAWDGLLRIRLRTPTLEEGVAFTRSPGDARWIMLCTGEVVAVDDAGDRIHLSHGWDAQLADALSMPGLTGPDLVEAVFGGELMMLSSFSMDVAEWVRGRESAIEAFLGE